MSKYHAQSLPAGYTREDYIFGGNFMQIEIWTDYA